MNGISTEQSSNFKSAAVKQQSESAETAGTVAMNNSPALFVAPVYKFIPTNPFSLNIDFSSYSAEGQENIANNTGFLQGFANAIASIGGFSEAGSTGSCFAAATASAGSSCGSCSGGGGFVC